MCVNVCVCLVQSGRWRPNFSNWWEWENRTLDYPWHCSNSASANEGYWASIHEWSNIEGHNYDLVSKSLSDLLRWGLWYIWSCLCLSELLWPPSPAPPASSKSTSLASGSSTALIIITTVSHQYCQCLHYHNSHSFWMLPNFHLISIGLPLRITNKMQLQFTPTVLLFKEGYQTYSTLKTLAALNKTLPRGPSTDGFSTV